MRIKSLAAVICLLLLSFSVSSCLKDDTNTNFSPNAVVMAFELDKVLGVNYIFTIDQLRGQIYNQDSLPVGSDTIIDRILITKLSVAGIATVRNSDNTQDSILNISDSLNLVGTMEKPFKFKVWAPDLLVHKEYSLEVRVHQQQPDSLTWGENPWTTTFAPSITGIQKSVVLNNEIFVYGPNSPVYKTDVTNGKTWSSATVNGLPNTELTSLIHSDNKLYATVANSTDAYTSTDGINWTLANLGNDIVTFIAPISNIITAIKTVDNVEHFATTDGSTWNIGEVVPQNFPRENISSTASVTSTGVDNVMIVGNIINPTENDTATVAWAYMVGQDWAPMVATTQTNCPKLENPSIMYYGGSYYIFGKGFEAIYKSIEGRAWTKVESMFLLPKAIVGKETDYSMVVGPNNFIWLMLSNPNEVWRGRLNRLGFIVQ